MSLIRFKFKWPNDLEVSSIKNRIVDWRGRETVSGFGHSLLHEIIILELMGAHGTWHSTRVREGGKFRKDSNLVLQFIRFWII